MASRPCCSRLVVTVRSLATSWPPHSDWTPKLSLRAITARLRARSEALFVGSRSGWQRNVHSAAALLSRARHVPRVLASGVVSPGLLPSPIAHSSLAAKAWRISVVAASSSARLIR